MNGTDDVQAREEGSAQAMVSDADSLMDGLMKRHKVSIRRSVVCVCEP